jgi:hypothetical protein
MLQKLMANQDGGIKKLFQRAEILEAAAKKTHSPTVTAAISELLETVSGLRVGREHLNKAFNVMVTAVQEMATGSIPKKSSNKGTQTTLPEEKRTSSVDAGTDTPCWGVETPKHSAKEARLKQPERRQPKTMSSAPLKRTVADNGVRTQEGVFTLVESRKKKRTGISEQRAVESDPPNSRIKNRRRRLPKTQAVVIDKPTGSATYADMVKEIKATVCKESMSFDITTRRAKSGNLVLETTAKEDADELARVLRLKYGVTKGVRRPLPSIALLLIGLDESVDAAELKNALVAHDSEWTTINEPTIREGTTGVRTAIIRVPLAPGLRLARTKKIKIGWSICRIKELVVRQGCAKCSAPGHATAVCTGQETRKCYRCKKVGHLIADCKSAPEMPTASQQAHHSQHAGMLDNEVPASQ